MPEGVTSIGWGAFAECQGLTNITIPNSVTSIDKEAFFNCNNLTFVKVENALPAEIYDNTFTNRSNAVLLVPAGSIASYQAADYWRDFKKIVDYIAEGDVNVDDGIDVLDVVDIARFVVGNPATILSGKSSDDT